MKLNGLEKYFETVNEEIVDLKQVDKDGDTPLMSALKNNKSSHLNLNNEQLDYLIKNSDLKQVATNGCQQLVYALLYNKEQNLNLSNEQLDYLIKNSDLKQVDRDGWSALIFALTFNKEKDFNLTKEQWKHLIENSDLSLIKDKEDLIELRKIQSELLNDDILNKIDITKNSNKKVKI